MTPGTQSTPLHRAAFAGHAGVVKELLQVRRVRNLFIRVQWHGLRQIIMVQAGASVKLTDADGMNVMHKAAQSQSAACVFEVARRARLLHCPIQAQEDFRGRRPIDLWSAPTMPDEVKACLT